MGTIQEHIDAILQHTHELAEEHIESPDEFLAVNEVELQVGAARRIFERYGRLPEQES